MSAIAADPCWALVGNPNCGKTALFNRLTGARQKVANYAGVTVERKEGTLRLPSGGSVRLLDLPGAYSLDAASPDEQVTRTVCLGQLPGERRPDALICVVDATNLRLHLRFVVELRGLGLPMLVALNLIDAARRRGIAIDTARLAAELGVPVVETVAVRRDGAAQLIAAIDAGRAVRPDRPPPDDAHAEVRRVLASAVRVPARAASIDEAIDRVALHPVAGLLILALVMFSVFQAVYAWAAPLQDAIAAGVAWLAAVAASTLPPGPLASLLTDGVFAGAGTVLEFLPQILVLFAFILALEETGYLPRAAFLLDRIMLAAGLSGRSFIPLLSSFACAIPGIMATRSIQEPRDRIATILVAPLMTCSARLPVYTLLIGAFVPRREIAPFVNLQGLVLFALYVAGIVSALVVARTRRRWQREGGEHVLLMELPSYRLPHPRDVLLGLLERGAIFLRRVGTVILAMTVLLWLLASVPAPPADSGVSAIEYSLAGRIGVAIQPLFAPLGFDWRICVALLPGLAAREVAVSALATVYALDADGAAAALGAVLAEQWSLATGLALLVWYIYAPMCLSTLAVIRRETNGWRHVGIAAGYLFALAWIMAFLTCQTARWIGG